jgi:hypothetical protein
LGEKTSQEKKEKKEKNPSPGRELLALCHLD